MLAANKSTLKRDEMERQFHLISASRVTLLDPFLLQTLSAIKKGTEILSHRITVPGLIGE
jgi:hypothetical protein